MSLPLERYPLDWKNKADMKFTRLNRSERSICRHARKRLEAIGDFLPSCPACPQILWTRFHTAEDFFEVTARAVSSCLADTHIMCRSISGDAHDADRISAQDEAAAS